LEGWGGSGGVGRRGRLRGRGGGGEEEGGKRRSGRRGVVGGAGAGLKKGGFRIAPVGTLRGTR